MKDFTILLMLLTGLFSFIFFIKKEGQKRKEEIIVKLNASNEILMSKNSNKLSEIKVMSAAYSSMAYDNALMVDSLTKAGLMNKISLTEKINTVHVK